MTKYIVAALFAAALVLGSFGRVQAQVTCTTVGSSTICNGNGGSVTCTRVGDTTICN